MAKKSQNGSQIWKGSFGHWNPHIIQRLNNVMKPTPTMVELKEKYDKAVELLKSVKTKNLFKEGIPLCPVILPKLQKIKKDDIAINKVGGYPDLRRNWLWGHYGTEKWLEQNWPRCGTCHQYMGFLAQFDVSDAVHAIHQLTSVPDKYGHFTYSSLGVHDKYIGFGDRCDRIQWTFFACNNASEHFYNQNFDAYIWTERMPSWEFDDEFLNKYMPNEKKSEADILKNKLLAEEMVKAFYKKHKIKRTVPLQKVVGMDLRLELDIEDYMDWKTHEKLEKIQEDNPDIFSSAYSRDFKMFGKPESQQEEARFFGLGNRSSQPYRLSPALCWDDDKNDITYQMYAEVLRPDGEGRRNLFAKIDSSCT